MFTLQVMYKKQYFISIFSQVMYGLVIYLSTCSLKHLHAKKQLGHKYFTKTRSFAPRIVQYLQPRFIFCM